jgi:hypothetical protein
MHVMPDCFLIRHPVFQFTLSDLPNRHTFFPQIAGLSKSMILKSRGFSGCRFRPIESRCERLPKGDANVAL